MKSFHVLLEESVAAHGHLCPGQVVGVRMAMLGCRLIRLSDPSSANQIKKILVYVEMDRCTADAVAHVTGVKLGRRSLKFRDYGIMAATFVNLDSGRAYRVISTEESRDLAHLYAEGLANQAKCQIEAYKRMPDSILFRVQSVQVKLTEFDLPGPTRRKVICSCCGQVIRDAREVIIDGRIFCAPCTSGCYFTNAKEIHWENMDWTPEHALSEAFTAGKSIKVQSPS